MITSVIRFPNATNTKQVDVYRQIFEVYKGNAISDSIVRKWVRQLNGGRDQVHGDERSSFNLWLMKYVIKCTMTNGLVTENRRFVSDLSTKFPQISKPLLHEIVSEKLKFRKLCSRRVPKALTEQHKNSVRKCT